MACKDDSKKTVTKYQSVSYFDPEKLSCSLEQYALIHFRGAAGTKPLYRTYSGQIQKHHLRRDESNHIWEYTRELIKRPLLKETCVLSESLQLKACHSFKLILKYMGDYPTKRLQTVKTAITDELFQIPLTFVALRNEVYCQIIKQITSNKIHSSQEKGWELLWLASGLFSCTDVILQNEMECFVQSYETKWLLAAVIRQRLSQIFQNDCRIFPPHSAEIDAIQKRQPQIFQEIYLPDSSTQIVKVNSTTKCSDIVKDLVEQTGIQSSDGFGLVLAIGNKVIGVDETSYFFDVLCYYSNHYFSHVTIESHFIFMKTHWINSNVGEDIKADIHFHYDQELAKYMYGYHKLSFEEAVLLGSYVYRAIFGPEPNHIESMKNLICELVPENVYNEFIARDWSKSILNKYQQHSISTCDEAKRNFLKYLSRWSTFASHFINAKKINQSDVQTDVTIAINERYVLIIDSNQDIINTYSLSSIVSWSYYITTNKFTFTTNEELIQFETELCYEISQLLLFYTQYAVANKDNIRTKHRISILCDSLL